MRLFKLSIFTLFLFILFIPTALTTWGAISSISMKHPNDEFVNSEYSTYANQIQNVSDYFLGKTKNDFNLFDINKSVMCMKIIDKWIEK